ncbi:MAG: MFS transporter [Sphingomonadaceae bacterium]|nr:MFS transporter [Sphingomonadaceae bacterium]
MASGPNPTAGQPAWRVALASAYCLVFGPSAILVTGFGAFARPLAGEFGWSPAAIVAAVIILALVIMAVSIVQGALIDRFGARRLILWSIPAFVVGLIAMARLPSDIRLFYAAFVIVPILAIGIWPVSYMKLTGSWFSRHLGLALGTANAGIGLGAMVVTPIAAWMIAQHGWRAAYLALAALAATTLPVAWLLVRGAPIAVIPAPLESAPQRIPWRDRELATIVLGYLSIGITGTGLLTNVVPMMIAAGLTPTRAVLGMTLFGITSLLGRFVSGWLLDRYCAPRNPAFHGDLGDRVSAVRGGPVGLADPRGGHRVRPAERRRVRRAGLLRAALFRHGGVWSRLWPRLQRVSARRSARRGRARLVARSDRIVSGRAARHGAVAIARARHVRAAWAISPRLRSVSARRARGVLSASGRYSVAPSTRRHCRR